MRLCKVLKKDFDFVKMIHGHHTDCIEKYKEENKNDPKSCYSEITIINSSGKLFLISLYAYS